MRKACRILLLAVLLSTGVSCENHVKEADGNPSEATSLIAESELLLASQDFDGAMEKSLRALELSTENPLMQVRSLLSIVGVDIMTSRDADAWEKAVEAEAIARGNGFDLELSSILIAKAKLCSYAEISPETGRNDEGLEYAREALALAEKVDAAEQQCEACYIIGSLYINKNRWNDPIDPELYRTAGEWLDKGQALADTYNLPRLRRNGILFRSRWFQQGDRNEEAIRYFEQVLSTLKDSDYLTASSLDDRLVRLYTRTGDYEKALDTHDDYVLHIQKYIRQKQDENLQEMETRFQVQEKERAIERNRFRTWLLVLALLLASAIILLGVGYIRKIKRRNAELKRVSDAREQIIQLLSKDLRNPANALAEEIAALSASAATLSPEQIREKCGELTKGMESINTEVATYVEDLLVDRSRRIADIGLSPREIEIIRLSAEGLTAAEIAQRTYLSVHTVNTHRQHIYAKMGVKNVADMLRKAGELGIL